MKTQQHKNFLFITAACTYFLLGSLFHCTGYFQTADCSVYTSAADGILDGSFEIYRYRGSPLVAPPNGNTFDYPGLAAYLMVPAALFAKLTGRGACILIGLPFILLDILCVWELRRTITLLKQGISPYLLDFISVALFGSYVLIHTSAYLNHFDSLFVYFMIAGVRLLYSNRLASGIYFGLGLATKQVVIIGLIPVALLLLKDSFKDGLIKKNFSFYAPLVTIFCIFFLPFFLADPQSAMWGVFEQQNNRTIAWWSSYRLLELVASPAGLALIVEKLLFFFQYYSNYVIIVMSVISSCIVMYYNYQRNLTSLFGLVTMVLILIPLLGKWSLPSYALPAIFFFIIWDTLRVNKQYCFPFVSMAFVILQGRLYEFESLQLLSFEKQPTHVSVLASVLLYGSSFVYVFRKLLREKY